MTRDKLDRWLTIVAVLGAVFYLGWIASAGYFNIAQRWADNHKLAVVANCQTVRGNIAKGEAYASENGWDINLHAIPNCPPVPKASVLPAEHPLPKTK